MKILMVQAVENVFLNLNARNCVAREAGIPLMKLDKNPANVSLFGVVMSNVTLARLKFYVIIVIKICFR